MLCITVDGLVQEANADERLIDVINRSGERDRTSVLSPAAWSNPDLRYLHGRS
jgi:hypothetical protein